MNLRTAICVLGCFLALSIARADPPAQVGRISYIEGNVSFHANSSPPSPDSADANAQWGPAQLNYPVTTGDALWADNNSRLELQIGAAEVRADQNSEIDVVRLDDRATALRVDQGIVNVHLLTMDNGRFSVVTPHGQIDFVKPGSYHVEVAPSASNEQAPEVRITTLEGQAHLDASRAAFDILPGESAIINGDPINVTFTEGDATNFDNWALSRERREQEAMTTRYVSPATTGYEDLDNAGRWGSDPDYGTVWYPAVAADWAPYRYGHWAYVDPWGWTWIDDAAWGFAPFHYGRWVYVHHAWGWCPGERVVHPVYAPALVAFVGGNHWSVNINAGARPVGWVPLGPHEVYRPYYPASVNYIRNINSNHVDKNVINNITINNTSTVNNIAANDAHENHFRNRDAMTVVSSDTFSRARPIHGQTLSVSHDDMAHAAPLQNPNEIKPVRSAVPFHATPVMRMSAQPSNTMRPANDRPASNQPVNNPVVNHAAPIKSQEENTPEQNVVRDKISHAQDSHALPQRNIPQENKERENPQVRDSKAFHEPPVVHAPPPRPHWEQHAAPQHPQELPHVQEPVQHPVQHTEIHPTPQGWQRAPVNVHPTHAEEHKSAPPQQHERHNDHQ